MQKSSSTGQLAEFKKSQLIHQYYNKQQHPQVLVGRTKVGSDLDRKHRHLTPSQFNNQQPPPVIFKMSPSRSSLKEEEDLPYNMAADTGVVGTSGMLPRITSGK